VGPLFSLCGTQSFREKPLYQKSSVTAEIVQKVLENIYQIQSWLISLSSFSCSLFVETIIPVLISFFVQYFTIYYDIN
jgi:hypothetical protein